MHCSGMLGKQCTCGLWHADGGRLVDTHLHEAPQPTRAPRFPFAPGSIDGPYPAPDADTAFQRIWRAYVEPALVVLILILAALAAYCRN